MVRRVSGARRRRLLRPLRPELSRVLEQRSRTRATHGPGAGKARSAPARVPSAIGRGPGRRLGAARDAPSRRRAAVRRRRTRRDDMERAQQPVLRRDRAADRRRARRAAERLTHVMLVLAGFVQWANSLITGEYYLAKQAQQA